ncbi:hypothetical protein DE146DRAFT_635687 [Phaeosphaeria sp. MPI-PUGE-AT-0046c]|nr:hypothetical protein DE146DRAFT_635687 [Phaeosphaeria sp. MPI-PUGE-AT-0046c]
MPPNTNPEMEVSQELKDLVYGLVQHSTTAPFVPSKGKFEEQFGGFATDPGGKIKKETEIPGQRPAPTISHAETTQDASRSRLSLVASPSQHCDDMKDAANRAPSVDYEHHRVKFGSPFPSFLGSFGMHNAFAHNHIARSTDEEGVDFSSLRDARLPNEEEQKTTGQVGQRLDRNMAHELVSEGLSSSAEPTKVPKKYAPGAFGGRKPQEHAPPPVNVPRAQKDKHALEEVKPSSSEPSPDYILQSAIKDVRRVFDSVVNGMQENINSAMIDSRKDFDKGLAELEERFIRQKQEDWKVTQRKNERMVKELQKQVVQLETELKATKEEAKDRS